MIDNTCDVSELQGRPVHVHAYFVDGTLHNAINNEQLSYVLCYAFNLLYCRVSCEWRVTGQHSFRGYVVLLCPTDTKTSCSRLAHNS